jgi:predicted nucleic acid-binding protein
MGTAAARRSRARPHTQSCRGLIEESNARGNLGFDAQIAAVCLEHGATTLLTEDRDFARFRSLKPLTLEVFLSH